VERRGHFARRPAIVPANSSARERLDVQVARRHAYVDAGPKTHHRHGIRVFTRGTRGDPNLDRAIAAPILERRRDELKLRGVAIKPAMHDRDRIGEDLYVGIVSPAERVEPLFDARESSRRRAAPRDALEIALTSTARHVDAEPILELRTEPVERHRLTSAIAAAMRARGRIDTAAPRSAAARGMP
jgi:hypothetical protein